MSDRANGAIYLARSIEESDRSGALLPLSDREHASREALRALELTGERLRSDDGQRDLRRALRFRAERLLSPLAQKYPVIDEVLDRTHWPPWLTWGVLIGALACGLVLAALDGRHRIDILAFPFLGVIVWNAVVYLALVTAWLRRRGPTEPRAPWSSRTLMRSVARPLRALARRTATVHTALGEALAHFVTDWTARAGPLLAQRMRRLLHLGSASLALGLLAGLYLRGLAFEYRATWESTFLDAQDVRRLVAFLYASGAWATGISVPTVAEIAALRAPGGENAARWLHLMAATVAAIVIVPRLVLALVAGMIERHRSLHFALPLDEPYFQRLLRGYRGGAARVRVIPYSYTPSSAAIAGLEAVVARAFGGSAAMIVASPIEYGADGALAGLAKSGAGTTWLVLLNASATPEHEVHGAFLAQFAREGAGAEAILALVDEGPWSTHWQDAPSRVADRRAAWRQLAEEARVPIVFVDLAAPELAAVEQALDEAIANRSR